MVNLKCTKYQDIQNEKNYTTSFMKNINFLCKQRKNSVISIKYVIKY